MRPPCRRIGRNNRDDSYPPCVRWRRPPAGGRGATRSGAGMRRHGCCSRHPRFRAEIFPPHIFKWLSQLGTCRTRTMGISVRPVRPQVATSCHPPHPFRLSATQCGLFLRVSPRRSAGRRALHSFPAAGADRQHALAKTSRASALWRCHRLRRACALVLRGGQRLLCRDRRGSASALSQGTAGGGCLSHGHSGSRRFFQAMPAVRGASPPGPSQRSATRARVERRVWRRAHRGATPGLRHRTATLPVSGRSRP